MTDKITEEILLKALDEIDDIVEKEHVTSEFLEEHFLQTGFDYNRSLDYEGFFIIPCGDSYTFDYGDTCSGGVLLNCDPREDKEDFRVSLKEALEEELNSVRNKN